MKTGPGNARVFFVVALVCAGYALAAGDYYLFDDSAALSANRALASLDGRVFHDWVDALASSEAGPTGRPLAMLTFAAQAALGPPFDTALASKCVNALLHGICALLLLALGRALARAPGLAGTLPAGPLTLGALAALLWTLLPLHVSTVLYPVQRMAQLSALFVLLALWLFARWRQHAADAGLAPQQIAAGALWLALLGLAATLAKENGVLLAWLLVLLEVVAYRGVWRGRERPGLRRLGLLLLALPLAGLGLVFLLDPGWILGGYGARDFTLAERLLTQLRVLWHYAAWTVLPVPGQLGFVHDDIAVSRSLLNPATTALAAVAWLAVIAVALGQRRRRPWLLLGLGFFLLAHSLESGVLALELVFEHRNYLPAWGVCLIVAGLLLEARVRAGAAVARLRPPLAYGLLLAALLALRTFTWADELRMAEAQVAHHPQSPRARYFLSRALERRHALAVAGAEGPTPALLRSRAQLQLMARLAPQDAAAPAALFLFDRRWFPGNPEEAGTLARLTARLDGGPVTASEFNGLVAVLERLLAHCGRQDADDAAAALLDRLRDRRRDALTWALADYRLARCRGGPAAGAAALARLRQRYGDSVAVHYAALEHAAARGDTAGMYEAIGAIEALDPAGRQVSRLAELIE